jgi:hypothetical protein
MSIAIQSSPQSVIQTIEILLNRKDPMQADHPRTEKHSLWGTCTSTSLALIYPQTQLGVIHCYPEVGCLLMFFHYHPPKKCETT